MAPKNSGFEQRWQLESHSRQVRSETQKLGFSKNLFKTSKRCDGGIFPLTAHSGQLSRKIWHLFWKELTQMMFWRPRHQLFEKKCPPWLFIWTASTRMNIERVLDNNSILTVKGWLYLLQKFTWQNLKNVEAWTLSSVVKLLNIQLIRVQVLPQKNSLFDVKMYHF